MSGSKMSDGGVIEVAGDPQSSYAVADSSDMLSSHDLDETRSAEGRVFMHRREVEV